MRVGAVAARSLASLLDKPLVGVNHIIAHIEIAKLTSGFKDPIVLFTSGANTQILALAGGRFRCFGETLDLGCGNFLDVIGRSMGMGFPAGQKIDNLAKEGKKYIELPYTIKGMDFAFSGIQTKVEQLVRTKKYKIEDLCFSAQETVFAELTEATERAIAHINKKEILLTGGVAANSRLQEMLSIMAKERGVKFAVVPRDLSGDQGAMIAYQGILEYKAGKRQTNKETAINQHWRTDDVDIKYITEILKPTAQNIKKAAQVLKKGGLVIYPTETSYGIGADPFNETAVKKIEQVKQRANKAGYIVVCHDLKQAEKYCYLTREEKELTKSKRPTTLIVKKKKTWPDYIGADMAFRISPHPIVQKLTKEFGKPIISTSANISGQLPVYSSEEACRVFEGKVDLILNAGKLPKRNPSRIIKAGKIIRN